MFKNGHISYFIFFIYLFIYFFFLYSALESQLSFQWNNSFKYVVSNGVLD